MYEYLCVCLSQSIRDLANSPFHTGVLLLDYCTLTESMLTTVVPTGRDGPLGVCGPSNSGGTPVNCVHLFVCVCACERAHVLILLWLYNNNYVCTLLVYVLALSQ